MASIEPGALLDFAKSLESDGRSTGGTKLATVVRVDGEQAYVKIPGGVDETPVATSGSVLSVGDTVSVSVQNGKLRANANVSNPSAGILKVQSVENKASTAYETSIRASEAADFAESEAVRAGAAADSAQSSATTAYNAAVAAQASATNANEYASRALGNLSTVQSVAETLTWITQHGTMTLTTDTTPDPSHVYFVRDANGDYTVGSYHYSIVAEPVQANMGSYYELSIDESLNNYVGTHLALTGEGLWLLPASSGTFKVLVATGAGSTYTTAGTYIIDGTGGIVGKFTADEIQIGDVLSGNYVTIDSDSMDIMHATRSGSTTTTTEIAHFGYGSGASGSGTQFAPYFTLGTRAANSTVGNYSATLGIGVTASGAGSIASGYTISGGNIVASGLGSHAEGEAQGNHSITASGAGAHAEGAALYGDTLASGNGSHAEGSWTTASGYASHAENNHTTASGANSHAEGIGSVAGGDYSHAQNDSTIASSESQTALGKYNVEDANGSYAVIVGNGNQLTRSNAATLDWSGNVVLAGGVTVAGHSTAIGSQLPFAFSSGETVSNNSTKMVKSFELPAGTWLVQAHVQFSANTTGYREIGMSTTSGTIGETYDHMSFAKAQAPGGGVAVLNATEVFAPTSTTTYYLNAWQNSGSSLTATGKIIATRLV